MCIVWDLLESKKIFKLMEYINEILLFYVRKYVSTIPSLVIRQNLMRYRFINGRRMRISALGFHREA
jgi:hypothetical protein